MTAAAVAATLAAAGAGAASAAVPTGANAAAASVDDGQLRDAASGFAGGGNARLTDVKAFSPNDVWIVGAHASSRFPDTPVMRHFDGSTWTRMGSLPHRHGNWCTPNAIDGLSDDDMWVACLEGGFRGLGPPIVTHWDGSSWHVQDIADVEGIDDLDDIWVDTPTDVWAVGNHRPAGQTHPLIEHYDGHEWKRMRVEVPEDTQLLSVSGTSPTDVWAVGDSNPGGYSRSVTLHFDGTAWSLVESLPAPEVAMLHSVAAIAPDDVWAVGTYAGHDSDENPRGLLLHWDGKRWADVRTDAVGNYNVLYGVSALADNDVWVVGTDTSEHPLRSIAVHWDGSSWTSSHPPSVGQQDSVLQSVSVDAHNDVWAAGWWWSGERGVRMYQRWDGTRWTRHVP